MGQWIEGDAMTWLVEKPVKCIAVLLIALVIRRLMHRFVDSLANRAERGAVPSVLSATRAGEMLADLNLTGASERRRQRARAMASLLKSVITGIVMGAAVTTVLAIFGIPVGPLLASAGILGIAVGFGAQTLVKDFLAGIFMILEDQYGVGDAVDLGEASGVVEAVGLRVTQLRDVNGTVWYVRNGEVLRVGNSSQLWSRAVVDVTVSPGQDLERITELLAAEARSLVADPEVGPFVLEDPEVWGVERIDPTGVVMRVAVKTSPMQQVNVARALRERVVQRFAAEGVAIPTGPWTSPMGGSPS